MRQVDGFRDDECLHGALGRNRGAAFRPTHHARGAEHADLDGPLLLHDR